VTEDEFVGGPRSYHKGWQNKRPGWTRRIKWYRSNRTHNPIRLELIDYYGKVNVYPRDEEHGNNIWERFIREEVSTRDFFGGEELSPPL